MGQKYVLENSTFQIKIEALAHILHFKQVTF